MGTTDISTAKSSGAVVDQSWYNDFRSLLMGAVLGRDPGTGSLAASQDLGNALYPWGSIHADGVIIDGATIDFSDLAGESNHIISGAVRTTSKFPDFLRPDGIAAEVDILGATTSLVLNIGGTSTTITTNITETSLTLAPVANNTATVNDVALTGQQSSKWQGEDGTIITISGAGSEITSRVGQYCVFQTSSELFLAYINSTTELTNCYRGFFFDSAGAAKDRVVLNDSDTLTILSTAWVFVENDAITVDVTYVTPIYSSTEPVAPSTGDYWFDNVSKLWKRYNGSAFVTINRILIGVAAIDIAACTGARSFDFNRKFIAHNPLQANYRNSAELVLENDDFDLSVYGYTTTNKVTQYIWNIATDLESGVVESVSTTYYAYISEEGAPILSDKKPYNQNGTLRGWYHPFNTWRAIARIENDSSSDFVSTSIYNYYDSNSLKMTDEGLDNLKALDGLSPVADKMFYYTSAIAGALTDLTSFARTLLDDTTATEARTTLGLGSLAVLSEVSEDNLATELETTVDTGAAFTGEGTATMEASLATGYNELYVYLSGVSANSGTGVPTMSFKLSEDGGITYGTTHTLGAESGGASPFAMVGLINIGMKIPNAFQKVDLQGSGVTNFDGVRDYAGISGKNGDNVGVDYIQITVSGLTGPMYGGTIKYKGVGKNPW